MGQNQVALAMCILDTTRYPRFANVAQKTRYPAKHTPNEGFWHENRDIPREKPSSGIQTPQSEHKKIAGRLFDQRLNSWWRIGGSNP